MTCNNLIYIYIFHLLYIYGNKRVSEMRAPLAARRKPAWGPEQATRGVLYVFEHKKKNILIHSPHNCIIAF